MAPRFVPRVPMGVDEARSRDAERKRRVRAIKAAGQARPPPVDLEPGPRSRRADGQTVEQLELAIQQRWTLPARRLDPGEG